MSTALKPFGSSSLIVTGETSGLPAGHGRTGENAGLGSATICSAVQPVAAPPTFTAVTTIASAPDLSLGLKFVGFETDKIFHTGAAGSGAEASAGPQVAPASITTQAIETALTSKAVTLVISASSPPSWI
jgi:hypothetical protein